MQQTEILSLAERLIPAYHSSDFDEVLAAVTQGKSPSIKLLVKMELHRVMAPCTRSVDLRGRVTGECKEYELNGITHWLDDVAFNDYHRYMKKFGSFTDGVWEALYNTRNNFRVMKERGIPIPKFDPEDDNSFDIEAIRLGYDLQRKENRLRIASQVEIKLEDNQKIYGATSDLSPSGARFKVPSVYEYNLGNIIEIKFTEFDKQLDIPGLEEPVLYRILGIEDTDETYSVKHLRCLKLSDTQIIDKIIKECIQTSEQRARHDNQDKIIRARTRAYEHLFLKHACHLPLFFSGNELKAILITESNSGIWKYWQDERNQQTLGSLFNKERMELLAKPGVKGSSSTVYSFKHLHEDKMMFFSMMLSEATPETRKTFWHIGAKRNSWRVFRISMFELNERERASLMTEEPDLTKYLSSLTHIGIIQEIGNTTTANDYLLVDKPNLPSNLISPFRHPRAINGSPISIFFDARRQRREPRYVLKSPITLSSSENGQNKSIEGFSVDISKRGLSFIADTKNDAKVDQLVNADFKELKLYNKELPLHHVEYRIVRISPNGKQLQLSLVETPWANKISNFFSKLIDSNLDTLTEAKEVLPSDTLLEQLHHVLLAKISCTPFFVERKQAALRVKAMGLNYPLDPLIMTLAKLGSNDRISVEPIFKGHSNSLLVQPMKHIEGAKPQYHDVYISVHKFGERIRAIHVNLLSDFKTLKERIAFIENAKVLGAVYILRISGVPIFNPITSLLKRDLLELSGISSFHARTIEKEISAMAGYGEIIDITEEVFTRLEISH